VQAKKQENDAHAYKYGVLVLMVVLQRVVVGAAFPEDSSELIPVRGESMGNQLNIATSQSPAE
jgi:hypothetical protein